MAQLSDSCGTRIKSENEVQDSFWSDEHDCMPLKKRLKMLLSSNPISDFADTEPEKQIKSTDLNRIDVVKTEDPLCDSLKGHVTQGSSPSCIAQEERNEMLLPEQRHSGMVREYCCQGTEVNEYASSNRIKVNEVVADTALVEKVNVCSSTSSQFSMLSKHPVKIEVDYGGNNLTCSLGTGVEGSLGTAVQAVEIKTQIADDFMDDLDHMVLKERQRLLLSRKSLELIKPVRQGNCSVLPHSVVGDTMHLTLGMGKEENHSGDVESFVSRNHTHDIPETSASDVCKTSNSGSFNGTSCKVFRCSTLSCQETKSSKSGNVAGTKECDKICLSKKVSIVDRLYGGKVFTSGNPHTMPSSSLSSAFVNIKADALGYGDVNSLVKDAVCSFPSNSIGTVKSEPEIPEESYEDKVDHMILRDRIQLLASRGAPNSDGSRNFRSSKKMVPSVLDSSPIVSESAKPLRASHTRKRRKTATDSVETALEEDAPGLLQVLIDKGVSVNEMKLYGESDSDDVLDDSFTEDSFSELEAVISKLFSQRPSLLKLDSLRCTKAEKASYCLACLISLVDQARYLQFRKWPVEWGWCRDLQSFIFVFQRHNRIVLERPEYGYATYFFELVDSLPLDWQLRRLVTAMKLTSCSRVTLMENRALLVGEDLTEGEARVLMEYGWIPDSGLGTMLNFCDRVVHDRRNEGDISEWRSKIGKLLMDGYNGGNIVLTDIPKKVVEFSGAQGPQIKLEM